MFFLSHPFLLSNSSLFPKGSGQQVERKKAIGKWHLSLKDQHIGQGNTFAKVMTMTALKREVFARDKV